MYGLSVIFELMRYTVIKIANLYFFLKGLLHQRQCRIWLQTATLGSLKILETNLRCWRLIIGVHPLMVNSNQASMFKPKSSSVTSVYASSCSVQPTKTDEIGNGSLISGVVIIWFDCTSLRRAASVQYDWNVINTGRQTRALYPEINTKKPQSTKNHGVLWSVHERETHDLSASTTLDPLYPGGLSSHSWFTVII